MAGKCNLRFDDTNPQKEDTEYVEAILEDIKWLGFQWDNIYYASDYFQQLWDFAVRLIKEGKAYIDEQSSEEIAAQRARQLNQENRALIVIGQLKKALRSLRK